MKTTKYIIVNRVEQKLKVEKKQVVVPEIKKVLGNDGILCEIEYQSGGTGGDRWEGEEFTKRLAGRFWKDDVRKKKGTSGFAVTLKFVIFPGEVVCLPRVWETSYEEIAFNKKEKVWTQCYAWQLFPGAVVKTTQGKVATVTSCDSTLPWVESDIGRLMTQGLMIEVEA